MFYLVFIRYWLEYVFGQSSLTLFAFFSVMKSGGNFILFFKYLEKESSKILEIFCVNSQYEFLCNECSTFSFFKL